MRGRAASLDGEGPILDTHEIHLRRGWEYAGSNDPLNARARLNLPTRWNSPAAGRLRLYRRFQRPPRMPDTTGVLRVRQSPGILAIFLNGRPIGPVSPEHAEHEIPLGVLDPRNELVLDVEPPTDGSEWGSISLIFDTES
jgi:hypothetical protein